VRYGLPLVFCASLIAASLHGMPAHAQTTGLFGTTSQGPDRPSNTYSPSHRFFVEFRARNAQSYGHMYVMYGEVNSRREVIKSQIAGFIPAGDTQTCLNCSVYYWTLGHVLPVPSEIGVSDGDLEEQYVLARYRVWIDEAQYNQLVAYINDRKAHAGPWQAFLNNCVTFGRDVAVFLHLKVPVIMRVAPSVVMYPKDVVEWIRDANGGAKHEEPLKDAPGTLPPDVVAELHAKASKQVAHASKARTGTTATINATSTASSDEKHAAPKNRYANQDGREAAAIH
jgi:hypothetical protein